jgi:ABC-type transport system involved in multi-copper enzyme maturation permease subunit
MLKYIIEKEIRDILVSTKFTVTFIICSLLIILSFYTGAKNSQLAKAKYEAGLAENLRQLEGLTDWLSVRQFRVYLPPQPLEFLVSGVSNDIGRTAEISGRGEIPVEDSRFGDDPIFAVFRFLDIEFVFQIILSLFAILFAYDAVNGEKEKGTLRLTFSNSIPKDTFILGKLIGAFLALVIPLLVPVLIGTLLLPLMGIQLKGDEWLRYFLIILSGFLFTGAWLGMSVFISSLTEKSSTSFLYLMVIWIFAVMIIPRLSIIVSGAAIEVPALDEINSKKARFISQLWNEDREKISQFKPTTGNDMQATMMELNKFMRKNADERDKKTNEFSSRLNEERVNKENLMQKAAFTLSRISPASSYSFAVTGLAGTSIDLKTSFKKSVEDYQIQYANFIISKTGQNPGAGMRMMINDNNGEKPKNINPREIPEFKFKPVTSSALISDAFKDMGFLLFFNIVFFAGAFFSFRKYDVR